MERKVLKNEINKKMLPMIGQRFKYKNVLITIEDIDFNETHLLITVKEPMPAIHISMEVALDELKNFYPWVPGEMVFSSSRPSGFDAPKRNTEVALTSSKEVAANTNTGTLKVYEPLSGANPFDKLKNALMESVEGIRRGDDEAISKAQAISMASTAFINVAKAEIAVEAAADHKIGKNK